MLKKIFFLAALFWTGVILFFCLKKASDLPAINFPFLDKIVHLFFHFVFTILWFLFFKQIKNSSSNGSAFFITVVFSFILGVGIEFIQHYCTTTRSGDVLDVVANLFGAFLAVGSILLLNKQTALIDKI